MKKFYQQWNKILWAGVLFLGSTYLMSTWMKPLTFDLSAGGRHTLSSGTREILRKLPAPVTLKLFYSKTAAAKGSDQIRLFTTHFEYVKEFLQLFEAHSQNKVKLLVVDPRPDTVEEEEAVMAGLKKFQLTDTETYIFGLVAQDQKGNQRFIEFFDPRQSEKLEYEIAKLLTTLHQGNRKRLGILSSEDLQRNQEWWISQVLNELYHVSTIPKEATEIKDVDVLFIFGHREIEEKMAKAIDKFIVGGGKIFLAIDPKATWEGHQPKVPNPFERLFSTWGLHVPMNRFAGDLKYAGVGRLNAYSPAQRLLPVLNCAGECLRATKQPMVSELGQITFIYPGLIETKNLSKDLKLTTLVQTSEKGNSYEDQGMGLYMPELALQQFKEGNGPLMIAGRLDGLFPSAYPETKVPDKRKAGALILVADQDFLRNEYAFERDLLGARPANGNLALLLNGIDALSGSPHLTEIRSRAPLLRPFTTIQAIQLEADQASREKVTKINDSILRFQRELAALASKADQNNLGVIQSAGLTKQKELQREIARLKRELREAKREGREKVETIGTLLYFLNVALIPLFVTGLFLWRTTRRRGPKPLTQKGDKAYETFDHPQPV